LHGARQISPRTELSRKLVGRVLEEHGLSSSPRTPHWPQPAHEGSKQRNASTNLGSTRTRTEESCQQLFDAFDRRFAPRDDVCSGFIWAESTFAR
jgi:hypothetical protein